MSVLDEWMVRSPGKVPNRLSALTIAQLYAPHNGRNSAPRKRTPGFPALVSGLPLTLAKYDPALPAAWMALLVGAEMKVPGEIPPPATESVTLTGTPVTRFV